MEKNERIFPPHFRFSLARGRDARATLAEEAIRKHLRPELVNRLTQVVHFKPLELETAREILGKQVAELNQRLAERNGKRSPKRHLMPLALRSKAVIGLRL
jgi:ATP-dependent Clp protease ATP-binding subunit ClpA